MSGKTVAVRDNARFDRAALADWMARNVPGFAGPLDVRQFEGGQSNPTFMLDTPGARYVMRRKPPGKLLKGAHAVDREARVMPALGRAGFPVPHVHALCTDEDVIGSWFYVMDMVEGRVIRDGTFAALPRDERAACYDAMNATLAQLHAIDPAAVGLSDYGRHGGYFGRQAALWTRQYRADPDAGRYADMDFLADWLPAHVPADGATRVVHGDFRCDNMIFDAERPLVRAVIDWELSTLGDPLVDFAYHLMMYRIPDYMPWGLAGRDLDALGLPAEADYVAAYCRRTGRDAVPDMQPYLALNIFRFAAIVHGIKGRMLRGNAASAEANLLVDHLEDFAAIARAVAEGQG